MLELPEDVVKLSLTCVGDSRRKVKLIVGEETKIVTHFSHMARVAFMVKHFFPEDESGRILAMLHDTKEEAQEGQEKKYKESDIADKIDLLTEEDATEDEIEKARQEIPEGFDPKYFAKYRKYIKILHENWHSVGAMELCDRLDQSSPYAAFEYLLAPKYKERLKFKALESFGRIWATINIDSNEIVNIIKQKCRAWFNKFDITEEEVEKTAKLFLPTE